MTTGYPLAAVRVPQLIVLDSVGSTNTELVRRSTDQDLADFTTLVTTDQTHGRGRIDRAWVAPRGASLAVSTIVPALAPDQAGWLALASGLAMSEAVGKRLHSLVAVGLKWPNDVLVGDRKIAGILGEFLPDGRVVLGVGVNVDMTIDQLPVPTATSLIVEGDDQPDPDALLADYLSGLRDLVGSLITAGPGPSGLRDAVVARCLTIGRQVRIEQPGGTDVTGVADGIDMAGRLMVRAGGRVQAMAAGDVVHLR